MASIKGVYDPAAANPLHTNLDVDFVIKFNFEGTGKFADQEDEAQAAAQFSKLIQTLDDVGLQSEVRNGDNASLLVFVKVASSKHLQAEVYRSRVQDWLYSVRVAAPDKSTEKALEEEPITEAERLRLVYLLISKPQNEGGAGITPKSGEWKQVDAVFALHDHNFNKEWLLEWSAKYFLDIDDLTKIRNRFGEKIAFYFAFLQSYFRFLLFPAAFGTFSWLFLGPYSPIYAVVNCLWCVVFIEYWKKQEVDLAVQWGVRGVSKIQQKRPQFKHEHEMVDPVTGEMIKVYSPLKRLARQALQIPFALAATSILGSLIGACFCIEIFIGEVYNGPFKSYLSFIPTILLSVFTPALSTVLTGFAAKLTDLENYETVDAHDAAMVQKIFVLNLLTSYLPLFLTAFVYVPFAGVLVPYLDVFQVTVSAFTEDKQQMTAPVSGFKINPDRLKHQVIYFVVTAQVVNFCLEVVVPFIKRKVFHIFKEVRADRAAKGGKIQRSDSHDVPEEKAFLAAVRNEAELGVYSVTDDLREMVVQFGYLSLFSVVWPLTAVSFLANNWVELRSDALKITIECQRPVPWRDDSIGPWLNALGFLTWLGSLTTSASVFLFSEGISNINGQPYNISAVGLLLTIIFSEHIYMGVQLGVRKALSKIDSPGLQKERKERFMVRRQYLEETLGESKTKKAEGRVSDFGEVVSRDTLEDEARESTLKGHGSPAEKFWLRQRSQQETIQIGLDLIRKGAPESKKKQ